MAYPSRIPIGLAAGRDVGGRMGSLATIHSPHAAAGNTRRSVTAIAAIQGTHATGPGTRGRLRGAAGRRTTPLRCGGHRRIEVPVTIRPGTSPSYSAFEGQRNPTGTDTPHQYRSTMASQHVLDAEARAFRQRVAAMDKSAPRKHHLVAASYLKRWADRNERVRVTATTNRESFVTAAEKAARETDFYSLASPDVDPEEVPPLVVEVFLGEIEGRAKHFMDYVEEHGCDSPDPHDAAWFAWFVGTQITRGRHFRNGYQMLGNEFFKLQMRHLTDEGIRQRLIENGRDAGDEEVASTREFIDKVMAGDYVVAPQPAEATAMAIDFALRMGEFLFVREWRVYRAPFGGLITCDEPVVLLGDRLTPRGWRPGVGSAGVILLPLSPHSVIAFFHPDLEVDSLGWFPELLPSEVDEVNMSVAANSHRWLFEPPAQRRTLSIPVAPPIPPRNLTEFPADRENPRSLIHLRTPTRWSHGSIGGLPVRRWWRDIDRWDHHRDDITGNMLRAVESESSGMRRQTKRATQLAPGRSESVKPPDRARERRWSGATSSRPASCGAPRPSCARRSGGCLARRPSTR